MRKNQCPHCGKDSFHFWNMQEDAAAVVTCDACNELSLLFRDQIIPLKKEILESGTLEERKAHLADVIGILLEAGLLNFTAKNGRPRALPEAHRRKDRREDFPANTRNGLISDQEMEHFLKIDLHRLDNPVYFKRIFG
ncbi:MAG TPA: hypothetical protein PLC40_07955 [Candidatus Hydrogenedentes bacterium]|nr:hypothetical protein [Candidatus Hydrogenedentota bacterium]HOH29592.1 hypothetical protein [Candidatus Hydrogenedentota bacterium]